MTTPQDGGNKSLAMQEQQKIDAPTVEHVLAVLDAEIEDIRNAQTQQGWTSWGLIGAIVGALWLLTDALKTGGFQKILLGLPFYSFLYSLMACSGSLSC